jgi:hypothetical protein
MTRNQIVHQLRIQTTFKLTGRPGNAEIFIDFRSRKLISTVLNNNYKIEKQSIFINMKSLLLNKHIYS